MSGDIFDSHEGKMQLGPGGWKPGMLQGILQCTEETVTRLRMLIVPGLRHPARGNGAKTYT